MGAETEEIKAQYGRRNPVLDQKRYDPLNPWILLSMQERERALCELLRELGIDNVQQMRVLEVGCGTGANLLQLLRLGFRPENLKGNDLLDDRIEEAARRLPSAVRLVSGDACELDDPNASFDIVLQSTVFTSIRDLRLQEVLASRMWDLAAPGGGVLWYDFTYNNPRNSDVKGVTMNRIEELFPHARAIRSRKITLAPPIARLVTRVHPQLYTLLNLFPFLRTHVFVWISKS